MKRVDREGFEAHTNSWHIVIMVVVIGRDRDDMCEGGSVSSTEVTATGVAVAT